MDVPAKLTKTLLDLAKRFGEPVEAGLSVPHDPTQGGLARLVGSSREGVNKALTDCREPSLDRARRASHHIYRPVMLNRHSQR